MQKQSPTQTIVSLPLSKLYPHPDIEKLARLSQDQPLPKTQGKPFLLPMTFFMTESQHATITRAFDKANGENTGGGRSGKRLAALCQMAEAFLNE